LPIVVWKFINKNGPIKDVNGKLRENKRSWRRGSDLAPLNAAEKILALQSLGGGERLNRGKKSVVDLKKNLDGRKMQGSSKKK